MPGFQSNPQRRRLGTLIVDFHSEHVAVCQHGAADSDFLAFDDRLGTINREAMIKFSRWHKRGSADVDGNPAAAAERSRRIR